MSNTLSTAIYCVGPRAQALTCLEALVGASPEEEFPQLEHDSGVATGQIGQDRYQGRFLLHDGDMGEILGRKQLRDVSKNLPDVRALVVVVDSGGGPIQVYCAKEGKVSSKQISEARINKALGNDAVQRLFAEDALEDWIVSEIGVQLLAA
jgi:hypothetical protein